MQKSREAFRTISEVADWLEVPAHVLRFWETRFTQIRPTKGAGGRRYYRPADMQVVGGIKALLRDKGMTIRGVQKLLREQGVKHVSSFSIPLGPHAVKKEGWPGAEDATPAPAAPDGSEAVAGPAGRESDEGEGRSREAPASAEIRPRTGGAATRGQEPEAAGKAGAAIDPARKAVRGTDPSRLPETDPEDDAEEFARGPGIAARVVLADRARLRAHRDELLKVAERLRSPSPGRSGES